MASDTLPIADNNAPVCALLNEADFEDLFRTNYAPLCAYCEVKFGLLPEAARDTAQSAFLKLWEHRQNLSAKSAARAYLYKIAGNSCLDLIKHQKVKHTREQHLAKAGTPPLLEDAYQNVDFRELSVAIDTALAGFPDQMRRIFIMCKMEGMKYSDAAAALDVSVKTVETQMGRALSRMRQQLSKFILVIILCIQVFL